MSDALYLLESSACFDNFYFSLTLYFFTVNVEKLRPSSLHRDTLGQIARLVHIRPPRTRGVVRQQLQRHHVQDG